MWEGPRELTVCFNSLCKVGPRKKYDVVILDECGLVRRHFLSPTLSRDLSKIYLRFVDLVRNASFVTMCQDGVTLSDVPAGS